MDGEEKKGFNIPLSRKRICIPLDPAEKMKKMKPGTRDPFYKFRAFDNLTRSNKGRIRAQHHHPIGHVWSFLWHLSLYWESTSVTHEMDKMINQMLKC
ncbi:hypothetical protein CEXT_517381 [Caerostris extrusa]|uniref:Uncharacterized protein n=1 Tax=Caerostris extrusa TaxID=172846 RepID=A0AAV4VB45_CAEEX|nr:hypothetical protein CEXT_517381 [Caerostris extrusa]